MPFRSDLAAYFSFDEASGNLVDLIAANNGVETSGTIPRVTGKQGTAGDFEAGDTEWFEVPHATAFNVGPDQPFSGCCWVWIESKGSNRCIFAKGNPGSFSLGEYFLIYNSGLDRFQWSLLKSPGTQVNAITTTSPAISTWHFLEWGHDPVANTIWIGQNGGTRVVTSHSTGANTTTTPVFIGKDPAALNWYWDGLIDEMPIFAKAISTSEVAEIWDGGNGLPLSGYKTPAPAPFLLANRQHTGMLV